MGQPGPTVGPQQASPEEQAQYDEVVSRALLTIFDEKKGAVRKEVLSMLKAGDDPKAALADAVAAIYSRVSREAIKAGVQISPDVRDGAVAEIYEALYEIATQSGVKGLDGDEAFNGGFYAAMDAVRLMESATGGVDPAAETERLRQMAPQFDATPEGPAPRGLVT
jgi:hypothetical protein